MKVPNLNQLRDELDRQEQAHAQQIQQFEERAKQLEVARAETPKVPLLFVYEGDSGKQFAEKFETYYASQRRQGRSVSKISMSDLQTIDRPTMVVLVVTPELLGHRGAVDSLFKASGRGELQVMPFLATRCSLLPHQIQNCRPLGLWNRDTGPIFCEKVSNTKHMEMAYEILDRQIEDLGDN